MVGAVRTLEAMLLSGLGLGCFAGGVYITVMCIVDGDVAHVMFGVAVSVAGFAAFSAVNGPPRVVARKVREWFWRQARG